MKGFINATPTNYSNPIFTETLETIPDKIENLHGYAWNKTSVVIHWTPPNSTNGPNFVRKINSCCFILTKGIRKIANTVDHYESINI